MDTNKLIGFARSAGVAVGVVFDPSAAQCEAWTASVGLDTVAAAASPVEAVWLALDEFDSTSNQTVGE